MSEEWYAVSMKDLLNVYEVVLKTHGVHPDVTKAFLSLAHSPIDAGDVKRLELDRFQAVYAKALGGAGE
jgi:hypothetical protein